jgi:gluconolactonase
VKPVIHREDPGLGALIAPDAAIEILCDGFVWTEGPVWIPEGGYLLFSDVPANRMYRWSEQEGASVFLDPSGYDGPEPHLFDEPGSNGLIRGPAGTILMCDHGNRAVARLDLASREKTFLATHFQGKRFNSPNDLALHSSGAIYFTDPPYGLAGRNESPIKELAHNGVYCLDPDGKVTLLDASLTFPNGLAFSPDERILYVAISDPILPIWVAYDVDETGLLSNKRIFADAAPEAAAGLPGLPDGMTIDARGNLFGTGPGGIHIFTAEGKRLGRIDLCQKIANCTFGEDGSTLFIASTNLIARLRTLTSGAATMPREAE